MHKFKLKILKFAIQYKKIRLKQVSVINIFYVYNALLKKGKLVGLLFDAKLNDDHPPFGGNKAEYLTYFEPYFTIDTLTACYNSEKNRSNRELFVKFIKK